MARRRSAVADDRARSTSPGATSTNAALQESNTGPAMRSTGLTAFDRRAEWDCSDAARFQTTEELEYGLRRCNGPGPFGTERCATGKVPRVVDARKCNRRTRLH